MFNRDASTITSKNDANPMHGNNPEWLFGKDIIRGKPKRIDRIEGRGVALNEWIAFWAWAMVLNNDNAAEDNSLLRHLL